jgi:hypothetical protein
VNEFSLKSSSKNILMHLVKRLSNGSTKNIFIDTRKCIFCLYLHYISSTLSNTTFILVEALCYKPEGRGIEFL